MSVHHFSNEVAFEGHHIPGFAKGLSQSTKQMEDFFPDFYSGGLHKVDTWYDCKKKTLFDAIRK